MAVEASAELRAEYGNRRVRESVYKAGIRAFLPQLSLTAGESDSLSVTGSDSFNKNYSLSLEQLLWDGGRLAAERRLTREELALLDGALRRQAVAVADGALAAYRQVLQVRAELAIRRSARESLLQQRRILAEEVKRGLALPADLVEADITLSESDLELLSLDLELAEAEQSLAESLGLEALPPLGEKVDISRQAALPDDAGIAEMARARSPDLAQARLQISQLETQVHYAALSWIPTLKLTGSFSVSGSRYPLTRSSWSVGLAVSFDSPWLSGNIKSQASWEPPYDNSATLSGSAAPVPDPATGIGADAAKLQLALARENYALAVEKTGRQAVLALEKCRILERRRLLALDALALGREKFRLSETMLALGQIKRTDFMDATVELAGKEVSAVQAAMAVLEGERQLETLLDLAPGGLGELSS